MVNAVDWDELRAIFERNVPPDLRHHAEDIAAEATARLFQAMENGTPIENRVAFGLGIVRNIAHEFRRGDRMVGVDNFECPAPPEPEPEDDRADEVMTGRLAALKKTVLSTSERHLIDEYYKTGGNVKRRREKIAAKLDRKSVV